MFHFQFGFKSDTEWILNGKQPHLRALDLDTVIHQNMWLDLRNITCLFLLIHPVFLHHTMLSHAGPGFAHFVIFYGSGSFFPLRNTFSFEQGGIKPKAIKIDHVLSCPEMV